MSKFTFALPNGKYFELTGPADATAAQAEKIFLEQLAAGAFVGLVPGDTLQAPGTQFVKFNLSRLDRGTAGTADVPLLAINSQGIISSLPVLDNIQVENGIDTADFVAQPPVTQNIGPLSNTQVQSLLAQIATSVDQPASEISQNKGVGKYGFNLPQLEQAGVVKPGTGCRFAGLPNNSTSSALPNPDNFVSVLSSDNIYTGVDGIHTLDDMLSNPPIQDRIQERLIRSSYNSLVATGEIQTPATDQQYPTGQVYTGAPSSSGATVGLAALGVSTLTSLLSTGAFNNLSLSSIGTNISSAFTNISNSLGKINLSGAGNLNFGSISALADRGVAQLGGLLSNASKFGTDTAAAWAKGLTPDALTSKLNAFGKQGQFAINFSDFKLPNVAAGLAPAAGFKGTVNRATLDSATAKIIGSNKIPAPSFGVPSPAPLGFDSLSGVMNNASSLLKGSPASLLGQANNLIRADSGRSPLPGGVTNIPGLNMPSLSTPGIAFPTPGLTSGASMTNLIGTSTTDTSVNSGSRTSNLAARQAAISDMELKKGIYEVAKAEYGISSPQAQEAFAAYKAALANLDNFA